MVHPVIRDLVLYFILFSYYELFQIGAESYAGMSYENSDTSEDTLIRLIFIKSFFGFYTEFSLTE